MKYLLALLVILASFGTAVANSLDAITSTVPFDFVIGNKTYPAGTYTISRISDNPQVGLHLESADGTVNEFFRPTTSASASSDQAKLQFLHQGNMYFLTGIFSGYDTYTVAAKHRAQRTADPSETVTIVSP